MYHFEVRVYVIYLETEFFHHAAAVLADIATLTHLSPGVEGYSLAFGK